MQKGAPHGAPSPPSGGPTENYRHLRRKSTRAESFNLFLPLAVRSATGSGSPTGPPGLRRRRWAVMADRWPRSPSTSMRVAHGDRRRCRLRAGTGRRPRTGLHGESGSKPAARPQPGALQTGRGRHARAQARAWVGLVEQGQERVDTSVVGHPDHRSTGGYEPEPSEPDPQIQSAVPRGRELAKGDEQADRPEIPCGTRDLRARPGSLEGGQGRGRTADLRFFRPALCQLSYLTASDRAVLAGTTGFEPATSGLTGRRELQASPRPRELGRVASTADGRV